MNIKDIVDIIFKLGSLCIAWRGIDTLEDFRNKKTEELAHEKQLRLFELKEKQKHEFIIAFVDVANKLKDFYNNALYEENKLIRYKLDTLVHNKMLFENKYKSYYFMEQELLDLVSQYIFVLNEHIHVYQHYIKNFGYEERLERNIDDYFVKHSALDKENIKIFFDLENLILDYIRTTTKTNA